MTPMHMGAFVVVLTAGFAAVNHRLLRLPTSIGLVIIALVASMVTMAVDAIIPGLGGAQMIRGLVESIDFNEAVMDGMLGFLLFAGALQVDLDDLKSERGIIDRKSTRLKSSD